MMISVSTLLKQFEKQRVRCFTSRKKHSTPLQFPSFSQLKTKSWRSRVSGSMVGGPAWLFKGRTFDVAMSVFDAISLELGALGIRTFRARARQTRE
jgi:hypothetical protein